MLVLSPRSQQIVGQPVLRVEVHHPAEGIRGHRCVERVGELAPGVPGRPRRSRGPQRGSGLGWCMSGVQVVMRFSSSAWPSA